MFPAATAITLYQTIGSDQSFYTVYITNVDQTNAQDVHCVRSLFMLMQEGLSGAIRESGFEWQADTVFNGFVGSNRREDITKGEVDRVYESIVKAAARLGVASVTRVIV